VVLWQETMEGGLKALNIGREWKGDDGLGLKMSL
jgi:hypothetical protein